MGLNGGYKVLCLERAGNTNKCTLQESTSVGIDSCNKVSTDMFEMEKFIKVNDEEEKSKYHCGNYLLIIFIAQFLTNSSSLNEFLDFAISLEIIYEATKLDCCEVVVVVVITFCYN
ncbi:Hypothetical protein CINCED_3A004975 [Cinara cedri]|uniref:Uncharacterized protein n=1 Tax=Cinara cedri TaxID=506608 RepID=A0A5E4NQH4_9HEMI|nr:Hypothetical protein CINCED_3A004975 [Cinara cedri]